MTFGAYIQRQRVACGLRGDEFATRLGISPKRLAELELNEQTPGYEELRRMARVLQLPETVLLTRAGYLRMADERAP